jgi:hypothetical protein
MTALEVAPCKRYNRETMTIAIILSWVFVAILTAVNIFIFLKLKKASTDMMKMAFPGTKNMGDAMAQMQAMMGQMRGGKGGPNPFGGGGNPNMNAQMKMAMDMLAQMQKGKR